MKKTILTLLLFVFTNLAFGQIKAVTETGENVLLYQDGTWKYISDSAEINPQISTNKTLFIKNGKSNFLVKSKKTNVGVWINPTTWSFMKGNSNDAAEFTFQKKGEDVYAMLISEKLQIPLENLKQLAINNATEAAPDLKIDKQEYRTVNGLNVLMMQMTGTIQGIRFTYYGYYYSNASGTVQFICYTGENLMDNYRAEIEKMLNGLVKLEQEQK